MNFSSILKPALMSATIAVFGATAAIADEKASAAKSPDLNFASVSTQSLPPFGWFPAMIALSLGFPFDSGDLSVVSTGSSREDVNLSDPTLFKLALGWALLSGGASSASSGPAGTLFLLAGGEWQNRGIDSFESNGTTFATNGSSDFSGVFTGLAYETPMGAVFGDSMALATLGLALQLGYGWVDVDAFNGSFRRSEQGVYYGAEAYMRIPVSRGSSVEFRPGLAFRYFDHGDIRDQMVAVVMGLAF